MKFRGGNLFGWRKIKNKLVGLLLLTFIAGLFPFSSVKAADPIFTDHIFQFKGNKAGEALILPEDRHSFQKEYYQTISHTFKKDGVAQEELFESPRKVKMDKIKGFTPDTINREQENVFYKWQNHDYYLLIAVYTKRIIWTDNSWQSWDVVGLYSYDSQRDEYKVSRFTDRRAARGENDTAMYIGAVHELGLGDYPVQDTHVYPPGATPQPRNPLGAEQQDINRRIGDLLKENFFPDDGTFAVGIKDNSASAPTIELEGKDFGGGKKRPKMLFKLEHVLVTREVRNNENLFYFIFQETIPPGQITDVALKEAAKGLAIRFQGNGGEGKIVYMGEKDYDRDDYDLAKATADATNWYTVIVNRVYNGKPPVGAAENCGEKTKYPNIVNSSNDYNPGEPVPDQCINRDNDGWLAKWGVGITEVTGFGPPGEEGNLADRCLKVIAGGSGSKGEVKSALVGAGVGAGIGAGIGSIIPGLGTGVGAIAGSIIGAVGGVISPRYNPLVQAFCWFVDLLGRFFFSASEALIDFIVNNVIKGLQEYLSNTFLIDKAGLALQLWSIVRTFVNILAFIGLLLVAFANLLRINLDTYTIKRTLPKIILAIIAANLSFLIARLVIGIANTLGNVAIEEIRKALEGFAQSNGYLAAATFAFAIIPGFGLGSLAIGCGLLLVGLLAAVVIGFLLAIQPTVVSLLVGIAPIAIVAIALPFTEGFYKQWQKYFFNWVFMLPAIGVIALAMNLMSGAARPSDSPLVWIASYVARALLLYFAIMIPFKLGGTIMQAYAGAAKWAGIAGGGYIGRRALLGAVSRESSLKDYLNRNPGKTKADFYKETFGRRGGLMRALDKTVIGASTPYAWYKGARERREIEESQIKGLMPSFHPAYTKAAGPTKAYREDLPGAIEKWKTMSDWEIYQEWKKIRGQYGNTPEKISDMLKAAEMFTEGKWEGLSLSPSRRLKPGQAADIRGLGQELRARKNRTIQRQELAEPNLARLAADEGLLQQLTTSAKRAGLTTGYLSPQEISAVFPYPEDQEEALGEMHRQLRRGEKQITDFPEEQQRNYGMWRERHRTLGDLRRIEGDLGLAAGREEMPAGVMTPGEVNISKDIDEMEKGTQEINHATFSIENVDQLLAKSVSALEGVDQNHLEEVDTRMESVLSGLKDQLNSITHDETTTQNLLNSVKAGAITVEDLPEAIRASEPSLVRKINDTALRYNKLAATRDYVAGRISFGDEYEILPQLIRHLYRESKARPMNLAAYRTQLKNNLSSLSQPLNQTKVDEIKARIKIGGEYGGFELSTDREGLRRAIDRQIKATSLIEDQRIQELLSQDRPETLHEIKRQIGIKAQQNIHFTRAWGDIQRQIQEVSGADISQKLQNISLPEARIQAHVRGIVEVDPVLGQRFRSLSSESQQAFLSQSKQALESHLKSLSGDFGKVREDFEAKALDIIRQNLEKTGGTPPSPGPTPPTPKG